MLATVSLLTQVCKLTNVQCTRNEMRFLLILRPERTKKLVCTLSELMLKTCRESLGTWKDAGRGKKSSVTVSGIEGGLASV
jgi:hypothetical protein